MNGLKTTLTLEISSILSNYGIGPKEIKKLDYLGDLGDKLRLGEKSFKGEKSSNIYSKDH